jgi:hypothetical protein
MGVPKDSGGAKPRRRLEYSSTSAGIPRQATIRDIEQGKDVKVSDLQAVAAALGLSLELVEQVA